MRGNLKPAMAALAAALCGCSGASTPSSHSGDSRTPAATSTPAPGAPAAPQQKSAPRAHVSEAEALKPRPDLPPEQRALLVTGEPGHPRSAGSTPRRPRRPATRWSICRDDWTPYIFAEQTDARRAAAAQPLPARLPRPGQRPARRRRRAAEPGEKNYLELYGIFPSLSVLRARFVAGRRSTPATTRRAPTRSRRSRRSPTSRPTDIKKRRAAAGAHRATSSRRRASKAQASRRCEELAEQAAGARRQGEAAREARRREAGDGRGRAAPDLRGAADAGKSKHTTGIYDDADAPRGAALPAEAHDLRGELPAPEDRRRAGAAAARQRLRRRWCARCASAWSRRPAILEDGIGGTRRTRAQPGRRVHARPRWSSSGSPTRQAALAFFKRHPAAEFKTLRAAVKLPPRPDYYADAHGPLDRRRSRRRLVRPAVRRQRATSSRSRASSTRTLTLYAKVGRQADPAGALAHDHRRLARRAGDATATSTSATRGRTSARA